MSIIKNTVGALALLGLLLPSLAAAETHTFGVDPVHSSVGFRVRHLVSKVPGHFDDFKGTVTLDPENVGKTLRLSATIQAANSSVRFETRPHPNSSTPTNVDSRKNAKIPSAARGAPKMSPTNREYSDQFVPN